MPFSYDSWRSVSNWSVDYSWWNKDPRETVLSDRLQKFLYCAGHRQIRRSIHAGRETAVQQPPAGADFDDGGGQPGGNRRADGEGFCGCAVEHAGANGEQRYYDGMLYLMSMMHASGEFRIIERTVKPLAVAPCAERIPGRGLSQCAVHGRE